MMRSASTFRVLARRGLNPPAAKWPDVIENMDGRVNCLIGKCRDYFVGSGARRLATQPVAQVVCGNMHMRRDAAEMIAGELYDLQLRA